MNTFEFRSGINFYEVVEAPDYITENDLLFEKYETAQNMGCRVIIKRKDNDSVIKVYEPIEPPIITEEEITLKRIK